jgi:hypothetical protein
VSLEGQLTVVPNNPNIPLPPMPPPPVELDIFFAIIFIAEKINWFVLRGFERVELMFTGCCVDAEWIRQKINEASVSCPTDKLQRN